MYIEQLYTACLSEAAYYIESNGEVAIIDPLRDVEQYITKAKERNASIKYVFETHFHADFVSGHITLAEKTNAPIIFGPNAAPEYKVYIAENNETFTLGNITIKAIHTPGHTVESTCYLIIDENNLPHAIFTGDTLFVGDVGRPDLFAGNLDKDTLAKLLYHSLQKKICVLPDHVIVYPAHGAGSACGKNIGKETFSTIGEQKANNYALLASSEEEFIQLVTTGLADPPNYFPRNAEINQTGYDNLDAVLATSLQALSIVDFKENITKNTIILDTRTATTFTQGFIPTSIFIGLEHRFAEWAGTLLPFDAPLLLVCEPGTETEAITRLARVGIDNVVGYLNGGFATWQAANEPIDMIIDIEADELEMDLKFDERIMVIDVRKLGEFDNGHIPIANHLPLNSLTNTGLLGVIDELDNVYVHCAGGYRSVIAASIMKKEGFHNIHNVLGGWTAIKEVPNMPIEVTPAKATK